MSPKTCSRFRVSNHHYKYAGKTGGIPVGVIEHTVGLKKNRLPKQVAAINVQTHIQLASFNPRTGTPPWSSKSPLGDFLLEC